MGEGLRGGKSFEKKTGSSLSGFEEKKGLDIFLTLKIINSFLSFLQSFKYRPFDDSTNPNSAKLNCFLHYYFLLALILSHKTKKIRISSKLISKQSMGLWYIFTSCRQVVAPDLKMKNKSKLE